MEEQTMVSIHCLAYNHEKFIAQALDSFLNQKTNFKFEVLVHDDASTDGTAGIIRTYQEKYPEIIKPIYQTTNQYSRDVNIFGTFQLPRAKGKYIAICEGDDYWVDPLKLQKQVDYMEQNPKCTLTFHNAIIVNTNSGIVRQSFLPFNEFYACYFRDASSIYTADEMIRLDFAPTNSLMFRTKDAVAYCEFYNMRPRVCGDLIMRIFYSSLGYAYYFSDKMSAYRAGVPGSASQRAGLNAESMLKTICGHLEILNDFDSYTNGKYKDSIGEAKLLKIFTHYYFSGSSFICREKVFHEFRRRASFKTRFVIYVKVHFPVICLATRKAGLTKFVRKIVHAFRKA